MNERFDNEVQWLIRVTAVGGEHYLVTFILPKRRKGEERRDRLVLMSATKGEVARVDTATEYRLKAAPALATSR